MFASYLAGRLAQLGVVLLLVSVAVFSIMHALPGDPVQLMLSGAESGSVTPERQEQLREEMGLNDPLYVQYGRFLRGAVTADLGTSVRLRAPVLDLILDRLGSTLALSLGGILFAVIIGVTTGVLAALKQGSWIDGFSRVLAYAGCRFPCSGWVSCSLWCSRSGCPGSRPRDRKDFAPWCSQACPSDSCPRA